MVEKHHKTKILQSPLSFADFTGKVYPTKSPANSWHLKSAAVGQTDLAFVLPDYKNQEIHRVGIGGLARRDAVILDKEN